MELWRISVARLIAEPILLSGGSRAQAYFLLDRESAIFPHRDVSASYVRYFGRLFLLRGE